MSHIFDALQRSEAERAGTEIAALPPATELLERAERLVAAQLDPAQRPEWAEVSSADPSSLFGRPGSLADQRAVSASPVVEPDPAVFRQFRELALAVTAHNRLVSVSEPESPAAEAFRLLGVRLRDMRRSRALKTLLITSTTPQEGKSLISANLACTLALAGQQRVVLIEGDLRRPSLSEKFGLAEARGIAEWLHEGGNLADSIYHLEKAGCWIMPAGRVTGNPLELLQSKQLPALIHQLSGWFDWVLMDSPPVMPLADTSVWARLAEGILLVTRPGVTEKRQLQRGIEAIDPAKLIGAILNSSRSSDVNDYYYYRTPPADTNAAG